MGNLAERIRAGGSGIPGFYTPTGIGTHVESGQIPVRYSADGKTVLKYSDPRVSKIFKGKRYLLEEAIFGDFAYIKCKKADKDGNMIFNATARNFNPDFA